jgi:hypothetical protein
MSPTRHFTPRRSDRKPDSTSQKDRRPPEPTTKIKSLDRKIGEAAGNLHSREEFFKRRHGTSKS